MKTAALKEFKVSRQTHIKILEMFDGYVFHRQEDDGSIHVLLDKKQESEVRNQLKIKQVGILNQNNKS